MAGSLRAVVLLQILAILLRFSLSQNCPDGCTCSLNGSNDGTEVVCNGFLDSFLVFHLVHPKIVSVVIRNYQNVESVDLSEHNIVDVSDIEIGSGPVKYLDLSNNRLTAASLQRFASLQMLEVINLRDNEITNFDTSNAPGLNVLHEINLEGNRLRNVVLNSNLYNRQNYPFLTIVLNDNPLECLCSSSNALAEFAIENTSCLTGDGQISTLQHACSSGVSTSTSGGLTSPTPPNVTTMTPQSTERSATTVSQPTVVVPLPSTPPSVDPTASQPLNNKDTTDNFIVIIAGTVVAILALLILLLFPMIIIILCRLRKRFGVSHDADTKPAPRQMQTPENYLTPIRTPASIRGIHYISESAMRLSQLVDREPYYEEIDPIVERLGPLPAPPPQSCAANHTSDEDPYKIVPYHVTIIGKEDPNVNKTNEPEEPNQYLDLQA